MNKVFKQLASIKLTLYIFIILGVLLTVATIINQEKAAQFIYNSFWFRAGLLFFCVNLIACTVKGFPYRVQRLGVLITHTGVIVIAVGVLIGGWLGQRGRVIIHEGQQISSYISERGLLDAPIKPRGQVNEKLVGQELGKAVTTFYGMMGWDPESGRPLDVTLDELDIAWAKGIV